MHAAQARRDDHQCTGLSAHHRPVRVRIRQPIGEEFAFSGDLAARYARDDVWGSEVARFGIDVWLTTVAVVEGHRVCQTRLGAKLHDPKDPGSDLAPMFCQVVGTLFSLARRYDDHWLTVEGAITPPTLGFPAEFAAEPVEVSLSGLARGFAEGRQRHADTGDAVLSPPREPSSTGSTTPNRSSARSPGPA